MRKMFTLKCDYCGKYFERSSKDFHYKKLLSPDFHKYCSHECWVLYQTHKPTVICTQCGISFQKYPSQIAKSKSGNNFCSSSCSATYNNLNKKFGIRRSKLEHWIEEQLKIIYPNILFKFNSKEIINSELDIFIPEFSIAFELNGIYHYKPIHGDIKYNQIQQNDINKLNFCKNQNIILYIIDTSKQKYFKPQSSQKYLDIICNIINLNFLTNIL
jgi:hypothetical protein